MKHTKSAVLSSDEESTHSLTEVLLGAGYDHPQHSHDLAVAKLRTYAPNVLVVDFDHFKSDKLESIRQLRFVLPECSIIVVSSNLKITWAKQCHMAGANGVLSTQSSARHMVGGLGFAVKSGCYTDPAFNVAVSGN